MFHPIANILFGLGGGWSLLHLGVPYVIQLYLFLTFFLLVNCLLTVQIIANLIVGFWDGVEAYFSDLLIGSSLGYITVGL